MKKIPLPPLTPEERVAAVEAGRAATLRARALLESKGSLDADALGVVLDQGVLVSDLTWQTGERSAPTDVWEKLLASGEVAVWRVVLGADARQRKPYGRSAELLNRVAAAGRTDVLGLLLDSGVSPNQLGPCGNERYGNALVGAVDNGHDGALDLLLKAGADPFSALSPPPPVKPDEPSYHPLSLLHLAATPHAVRVLVTAGLPVDQEDSGGHTALERTLNRSNPQHGFGEEQGCRVVTALLDAGAALIRIKKPHSKYPQEWNALRHVFESRHSEALVRLLVDRGARWTGRPPHRPKDALRLVEWGVPVDWAQVSSAWLARWMEMPVVEDDALALRDLVWHGLEINPPAGSGKRPTIAVAMSGRSVSGVKAVIRAGCALDEVAGWSRHPDWTWLQVWTHLVEIGDPRDTADEMGEVMADGGVQATLTRRALEKIPVGGDRPSRLRL